MTQTTSKQTSWLASPVTAAEWLEEPSLVFAGGRTHTDPRTGIPLYGPRSLGTGRHREQFHVGFVGTAEAVDHARQLYSDFADGVAGDDEHAPFPGSSPGQLNLPGRGYRFRLCQADALVELVTRQEQRDILGIADGRRRFETLVGLLQAKTELLCQKDHPLDCIAVALPTDLYRKCRVVRYIDPSLGTVHRDLRRAYKAAVMRFQKPTQILLPTTTGLAPIPRQNHRAEMAWNLFTAFYYKVGGLPWGVDGLAPGSCFVGISFFRPLGDAAHLRTSVVQAFDEEGNGLVLRGRRFPWDERRQGRSPHLTAADAARLVEMVLEEYRRLRGTAPRRVVVHKTSRFEPEERDGFEQALAGVDQFDLLALSPSNDLRLLRAGRYPPLRGLAFRVGDIWSLYTTGYMPGVGYLHGHVPTPLQVADHVGDTPIRQLLREILVLTKMNWNSADAAGASPISLRFSRRVGDILREVPDGETPQPSYRFYM